MLLDEAISYLQRLGLNPERLGSIDPLSRDQGPRNVIRGCTRRIPRSEQTVHPEGYLMPSDEGRYIIRPRGDTFEVIYPADPGGVGRKVPVASLDAAVEEVIATRLPSLGVN